MEELIKEFPGKYTLDTYLISEIFDKALKEKSSIKEAVKALLEKVYGKMSARIDHAPLIPRVIGRWAFKLANQEKTGSGLYLWLVST